MKWYLLSLAAGIMLFSACASEDLIDVSPTQGNAIGFENVVNKSTRAVDGDLDNNTFDNFLVYGYYTKEKSSTPIQIFNGVSVKKNKNTTTGKVEWTYSGVRYWIPNCTYYFYAYSCADVELTAGKGSPAMTLTNETSVDGRALAIFSYLCDGTHQHDLVCAENEGIISKESGNQEVSLNFSHALCKIKASFTTDFPAGYVIRVSNVRITEFNNLADFNVGTGVWSEYKTQGNPRIDFSIEEGKNTLTNAPGSSVETSEIFLIPKIYTNTEYVKLHFTVEMLKDGESVLQRNITGTWSPKWEKSRIYKYNINITGSSAGIQPIVFAAFQTLDGTTSWEGSTEVSMVFGVDTSTEDSSTESNR